MACPRIDVVQERTRKFPSSCHMLHRLSDQHNLCTLGDHGRHAPPPTPITHTYSTVHTVHGIQTHPHILKHGYRTKCLFTFTRTSFNSSMCLGKSATTSRSYRAKVTQSLHITLTSTHTQGNTRSQHVYDPKVHMATQAAA